MSIADDTIAILGDGIANVSANLIRKSTASAQWDSAGVANWSSTTTYTSLVCHLQERSEAFIRGAWERAEMGEEDMLMVKIYASANADILTNDIIETGGKYYHVRAVKTWTGSHKELNTLWARGAIQP